jgi:hypothetical protein
MKLGGLCELCGLGFSLFMNRKGRQVREVAFGPNKNRELLKAKFRFC